MVKQYAVNFIEYDGDKQENLIEEFSKIKKLIDKNRELEKEVSILKEKIISGNEASGNDNIQKLGDISLLIKNLDGTDAKTLRTYIDNAKNKLKSGIVVVGSVAEGKVALAAGVTKDLTHKFHAGNIIKQIATIVGGSGGGRPDMAQAGGTHINKLDEALKKAEEADLNLIVIEPKNLEFTGFLKDLIKPNSILVINKCDLKEVILTEQMKKIDHVIISVKNNTNLENLILKIKSKLKGRFVQTEEIIITRERHRQHLLQCVDHLNNFSDKNDKKDFDKAAEDLRLATRQLGMIVGKVDLEEILGSIFNDFCIGK